MIDLFTVSVLLDAGAGNQWAYHSKESGKVLRRSEGLAVASLEMFKAGAFSSDADQPHMVDKAGLKKVTVKSLERGMQVSEDNPITGLEGRAGLLMRLSEAMGNADFFGSDGRPGNMIGKIIISDHVPATPLTICRLSTIASLYSGSICPHCSLANTMGSSDGWLGTHLAVF